jgi:hypothetical protein
MPGRVMLMVILAGKVTMTQLCHISEGVPCQGDESTNCFLKKMIRRETKADTLKATEANRKRGPGTREKARSKRINLEGNTHAQEINVSQLPV